MTTPLAHVVFVLDDSGSMEAHRGPTIKAFNAYVETLKKVKGAEVRFSLKQMNFNSWHQWNAHIQDAVELNGSNYSPSGGTPMAENICGAIEKVREELKSSGDRKVVICIQTDGGDGSGDYWRDRAREEIRKARKEGWEFVFMGATESRTWGASFVDFAHGMLGIPKENIMAYSTGGTETLKAFSETAMNIGAFASGRSKTAAYRKEEKT